MSGVALVRESLTIAGPAGGLETLLERPRTGAPRATAVVCHPHPLFGGTLNNKVSFTLARTALEAGAVAARFNFRGVGRSSGSYGAARGEVEDLRAVEQWLAERYPAVPRWRLGFSFGAAIAIKRSTVDSCAWLVTVAPPVDHFSEYGIRGAPHCAHWLIVQGADDEVVDASSVAAWAKRLDPAPEVRMVDDAGHFFHGRLKALRETVLEALGPSAGGTGN